MNVYPDQITVNITQADIDNGRQTECRRCPIALASARVFSPRATISVSCAVVVDDHADSVQLYHLSPAAKYWINLFDDYGARFVSPTTLTFQRAA